MSWGWAWPRSLWRCSPGERAPREGVHRVSHASIMPDPTPSDLPAPPPVVPPSPRRSTWPSLVVGALVVVGLVGLAVVSFVRSAVPRISEETVQTAVWTAVQREAPAQFLVVGTLDIGTESEARSTTRLLPGMLDLPIGQTTVRVRVPGRAAYGFDVNTLRPRDIRYTPDGTVVVTLPPLTVFSVEPVLEDAEISVDARAWQRLSRAPERAAVSAALGQIRPAIRTQAETYLADNAQPRRNAARAVERVIRTPLEAAGVRGAHFRFVVAPGDTVDIGRAG